LLLISKRIALKYLVAKISRKKRLCFEIKGKIVLKKIFSNPYKEKFFAPKYDFQKSNTGLQEI